MINTLAYYGTEIITSIKKFMVPVPRELDQACNCYPQAVVNIIQLFSSPTLDYKLECFCRKHFFPASPTFGS